MNTPGFAEIDTGTFGGRPTRICIVSDGYTVKISEQVLGSNDRWHNLVRVVEYSTHFAVEIARAILEIVKPAKRVYALEWSDRKQDVDADDPNDIAETVVACALDHSYDRGDGVPWGLPDAIADAVRPVVARHLAAKRADWLDNTVDMGDDEKARFHGEVLAAVMGAEAQHA